MLESNLATIINILAKENLGSDDSQPLTIPYEVEKKIYFNDLQDRYELIVEYNEYCGKIDRIYSEYDREGSNKSRSVLDAIKKFYEKYATQLSGVVLFDRVIECVVDRIQKSPNFIPIPIEELEMCVRILVVDTFIRCKIFKNPEGNTNAIA